MTKHSRNSFKPNRKHFAFLVLTSLICCLFSSSRAIVASPSPDTPRAYIPTEMQVIDPSVKALMDSADTSTKLGKYRECPALFQQAIELATRQKSAGDRAIVEDKFAVYYFSQGNLEGAKSQWLVSLSDGAAVSNLVLQADVLVALSALQQAGGHIDQAMVR